MHGVMIAILNVLIAVNLFMIWRLRSVRRTDMVRRLRNTSVLLVLILAVEAAILLCKGRRNAYIAFTIYYILLAWYVLMVFRFCVAYAGSRLRSAVRNPLFWITVAETGVLLWGMVTERFFTITHAKWFNHIYWVSRNFPIFYVYAALLGVELLAAIMALVAAALRSAGIYRLKYVSVIAVLSVVAVYSVFTRFRDQPTLVLVFVLAVSEVVTVQMALYYAPRKLRQLTMQFVADQLNDGIALYNEDHELQLVSAGMSEAFGDALLQGIEDEEKYWKRMIAEADVENAWNGYVKRLYRAGQPVYYDIQYKELEENGKLVGTVYWIKNVTEAVGQYQIMVHRANFDELTGIYNEAHFHETAKRVLEDNPDTKFVMLCSSMEKQRVFRQLFGRQRYNEYLIQTARELEKGLDVIPNCRYGKAGESDFTLMMPKEFFKPQDLIAGIDRVTDQMRTNNFDLVVKAGVYEITEEQPYDMAVICNKALMACETVKGVYGKRIGWFDEALQKETVQKERYNAELSGAIANGEIRIYLQPQLDSSGKLIGAEALARWIHREDGFLSPGQFIPHFEKNGKITELDICIWRLACARLQEWKKRGRGDLHISVNISSRDMYTLDIYDFFVNLVREYDIAPANLKLEITESAIVGDLQQYMQLVSRLQEAGFEVEMDDFGSAYSSFNMLKDICVDVLKIDMMFLGDTQNQERSHTILKSIIELSKMLHMKTVAEGVETEEQLKFLQSIECDVYQGYYFAKPMPVEEFEDKYL